MAEEYIKQEIRANWIWEFAAFILVIMAQKISEGKRHNYHFGTEAINMSRQFRLDEEDGVVEVNSGI